MSIVQKQGKVAWRLLWLSLICCVLEGAARKWAVGDSSILGRLAYLSKDIILAAFLALGPAKASPLTDRARPLLFAGLLLLGLGVAGSAASGINPVGAVLTFRTFFVLPVAAWAAARLLPPDALQRFARWVVLLSLPMAFLGVKQFYSPANALINRYSTIGEYVAKSGVSERVRATGSFSYISGFGEFAKVSVWAAIVTLTLARTRRDRLLGSAGLIAGMACGFVTVSRAVALVSLALLAVWAVAGGKYGRKVQAALTVALLLFALTFVAEQWDTATEIATTVYSRHAAVNDSFSHRMWYNFVHPMDAFGISPFGEGLGSQQVASSLSEDPRHGFEKFESAWGRAILELGVLGFIGFLMTIIVAFVPLWRAYIKMQRGELATVLAVTIAAIGARAAHGFQFNHVAAYFFWAMTATALALFNQAPSNAARRIHTRWQHRPFIPAPKVARSHKSRSANY